MKKLGALLTGLLLASACAGGPATTREKGALTGAAIGAGTGAIIGSQTGKAGTGALIGGAIGGVTGAIVGGAIQEQEQQRVQGAPVPPPPQPGAAGYPQQQAGVSVPGQYQGDPTRGELVNESRWRVAVYIDTDPGPRDSTPTLWLGPTEAQPANLDIGEHRIVARAYVDTQFGRRLVGRYDKTIAVDPRSTGWSLRFGDGDFR